MSDDDDDSSQIVRRGRLEIHQTCVCLFLLYHGPLYVPEKIKKKERKKDNPWSYVKIIARFGFTKLSIRIGTLNYKAKMNSPS